MKFVKGWLQAFLCMNSYAYAVDPRMSFGRDSRLAALNDTFLDYNVTISNIPSSTYNLSQIFTDDSEFNAVSPVCDMNHYGSLDRTSCRDVAHQVQAFGQPNQMLVWATSGYFKPHLQVPYRFSSRKSRPNKCSSNGRFDRTHFSLTEYWVVDGTCVADVFLKDGVSAENATIGMITTAERRIRRSCLESGTKPPQGGYIRDIGKISSQLNQRIVSPFLKLEKASIVI